MLMLHEEGNVFNGYTVFVLRCWPMPHTSRVMKVEQVTMKSLDVLWMDLVKQRLLNSSQYINTLHCT